MSKPDAWIHMVEEDEAESDLLELFEEMRDPSTGQVDHILRIHGQHPETLRAHWLLYRTVMYGRSGITRPEREMIGVVVSALNGCHY